MSDDGLHDHELASVITGVDVDISCGFTYLTSGETISGHLDCISQMLQASSPAPIEQFQIMYPDQHNFRVQLIDETIRFEEANKAQVFGLFLIQKAMLRAFPGFTAVRCQKVFDLIFRDSSRLARSYLV